MKSVRTNNGFSQNSERINKHIFYTYAIYRQADATSPRDRTRLYGMTKKIKIIEEGKIVIFNPNLKDLVKMKASKKMSYFVDG